MATQKNNVVTHGLSGKVGDMLLFRQRAGNTIVGKIPENALADPTAKQLAVQEKFTEGAQYAKSVIADPATKALYDAMVVEPQTAFNLALADYCVPPDIKSVDVSLYAGVVGNKITVKAIDNFMVKHVKLEIRKPDNSLIEQGDAVQDPSNGLLWVYTATAVNAAVSGTKIIAKAIDLPGNITEQDEIMP